MIQKVLDKEPGAQYPTLDSVHDKLQEVPETVLPKTSKSTTYRILKYLGFRFLRSNQINCPLLIEDERIIKLRKTFIEKIRAARRQGKTVYYR